MPTSERGAAGALAVLFLPVLLAALASLLGLGDALLMRHRVGQAADFGALAAVQCLDLTELAEGRILLLPGPAGAVAREYARANLTEESGPPDGLSIEVDVLNPGSGGVRDRVTGRTHRHATVCVEVRCRHVVRLGPLHLSYQVAGHADASAVPR